MSYQFSTNSWGERYIDSLHRQVFEPAPSDTYFDNHMHIEFDRSDVMYVVTGSDSGLLIRYMATWLKGTGTRAVFIEPDDIYETIIAECSDFLTQDGTLSGNPDTNVSLHSQSQWQKEVFNGEDRTWFLGGEIELLESQACLTDYNQTYLPLFKEIRSAIEKRRFDVSNEVGSKVFARTQIINAADNLIPLQINTEFGKDRTAIVLAGGPSLDTHIDWVIENRDKLFIVAISRLCSKLQSLDLKPDVVVTIDPYFYSYDVSKHGLLWSDVPLIAGYHTAPQLLQEWRGPKYFLGTRLPWTPLDSELAKNTIQCGGPTVGHTAVIVASQLGFTQILMTGVDLCYSAVNTHSVDSPEAAFQTLPSLYDAQVETYSGQMAGTQYRMQRSVKTLENLGSAINEFEEVLFNLSEHAVKIPCIPYKSVNEVVLNRSKADFSPYVEQYKQFDVRQDLKDLLASAKVARTKYHFIRRSCQQALQTIVRMYAPNEVEKRGFYNAKLDKIDQRIEKRAAGYMAAIQHFQSDEMTSIQKPSGFDEMDETALEEWISSYYTILEEGALIQLKMLDELETRANLRLDEVDNRKSIEELIEAWKADLTPGRIFSGYSNIDSESESVQAAQKAFLDSVHDTDTRLSRKLKSYNLDIDNCMRSLTYLYNIKNTTDLQNLSDNLVNAEWPGNVLRDFALGLIDDLNSDHERAVDQYQSVINNCSDRLADQSDSLESMQRIIEESLVRMTQAYLSMGRPDEACSTLGTLCEMLPQYIMSYAKLLNLCGQTDTSVELLSIYIENFPSHWEAAQLMSDILSNAGRKDEADLALTLSFSMKAAGKEPTKKAA